MADVAGIPASSGATQARAGSGDAAAVAGDSAASAFKATDYSALLAALGDAGRFEARGGVASPLRRTRREGAGDPPSSAAVLRERLRGSEPPAASAAAEAVRPAGSVMAPPGKPARGPGPIATMVIAYLALVAASGGTIFYVWGGEHTSLTSITASMKRFRATLNDAVATRGPAGSDEAAVAVPPSPSASVAIREAPVAPAAAAADASVEARRKPEPPAASPPVAAEPSIAAPAVAEPLAAAAEPPPMPPVAAPTPPAVPAAAAPPPAVEPSAAAEEPAAAPPPVAEKTSLPPSPRPAAAPAATAPARVPTPASPPAPAPSVVSPAEIARLLHRGDELVATGDIAAARLFYERAADGGSSRAATALGKTYDPAFLKQIGVRGGGADAAKAAEWYRRAGESGDAEATARLKALRVGAAR
ncbi:MAG TPA: hypothetical protein VGD08_22575 [Stellaceae bacterium]|jgi:hypothetical protein